MFLPTAPLLALLVPLAQATTYDEPWQEDVLRGADSLVKLRILEGSGPTETRFERLEQLAGREVPERGVIDRFVGMEVTSWTPSEHLPLLYQEGQEGYFLLRATDDPGHWSIPTPTAGVALVEEGQVTATFRHSYHQALVPEPQYRDATLAIFQHLHGQPVDTAAQRAGMEALLDRKPAASGIDTEGFFAQHVALESCYYFCAATDLARLEPFLASEDGHVQISAARALSAVDSPAGRARLLAFVQDDTRLGFARVMAVWGLRRLDAREHAEALRAYLPSASTDDTGFGGNIMDPRVGTAFPDSVHAAIQELLASWAG